MMVATLSGLGQSTYQWTGEPAGYVPMNDPSNPCYQDPNVATIVAPPPSAACNAWMQQHGYTYQPGYQYSTQHTPVSSGPTTSSISNFLTGSFCLGTSMTGCIPNWVLLAGAGLVLLLLTGGMK